METVAQKTKRIIADALGVDQRILTYNTDLKADLGADSLDILEAITILENEFGVSVADERIARMKCLGDFIQYFEQTKLARPYTRTLTAA